MRGTLRLSLGVILLGIAACSDAGDTRSAPPPPDVVCAADEQKEPDGTCILQASGGCPSGTRPAIGTQTCFFVGPTACAPGFEPDKSGFGCAAILRKDPVLCLGAFRPALGAGCIAVGDCSASFPPANAILVDPNATVDATHVKTLDAAIAAAPAGGTIALADGTHTTDALTISKEVTIVGRCADKARLVAAATATSGLAIRATTTLRGLTIASFPTALSVAGTIDLEADAIVIEGARTRAILAERSASVELRESVIRGTRPASATDQTIAVLVGSGAHARLVETAILDSIDGAVAVTDSDASHAELLRSVIAGIKGRDDNKGGEALRAFEGARLDVTESAIIASTGSAILTFRKKPAKQPPSVTVKRSVLSRSFASTETGPAIGTAINAAFEAKVHVEDTTIADSEGTGLYAAENARIDFVRSAILRTSRTRDFTAHASTALKGGVLAFEDSAIVRSGGLGVGAWERGRVTLVRSLIQDIGGDVLEGLPAGQGLSAHSASVIEASDSAIVDAQVIGAAAARPNTTIRLDRVLMTRGNGPPPEIPLPMNHGLLSVEDARIEMTNSTIQLLSGVAIFAASGGGVVSSSVVRDNAVAVHVQEGSTLTEVGAIPETIGGAELVIATDTRFLNNASRSGSGALPLPVILATP